MSRRRIIINTPQVDDDEVVAQNDYTVFADSNWHRDIGVMLGVRQMTATQADTVRLAPKNERARYLPDLTWTTRWDQLMVKVVSYTGAPLPLAVGPRQYAPNATHVKDFFAPDRSAIDQTYESAPALVVVNALETPMAIKLTNAKDRRLISMPIRTCDLLHARSDLRVYEGLFDENGQPRQERRYTFGVDLTRIIDCLASLTVETSMTVSAAEIMSHYQRRKDFNAQYDRHLGSVDNRTVLYDARYQQGKQVETAIGIFNADTTVVTGQRSPGTLSNSSTVKDRMAKLLGASWANP